LSLPTTLTVWLAVVVPETAENVAEAGTAYKTGKFDAVTRRLTATLDVPLGVVMSTVAW
jgi:hypothetical protein